MEQLGDFLLKHIEGIAAYCDHVIRFGVVESINTTIKAVLRRARGMRRRRDAALEIEGGHRPPHSVGSRLDALSHRSTAVLKSVKTEKSAPPSSGAEPTVPASASSTAPTQTTFSGFTTGLCRHSSSTPSLPVVDLQTS